VLFELERLRAALDDKKDEALKAALTVSIDHIKDKLDKKPK